MTEPPSRFTGRISLEPVVTQPTSETQQYEADGREWIVQSGTFELQSTVSSSDDRFSGELSQDMAWDEYWLPDRDPANERPRVMSDEWHLENDHGSWTGTWRTFHSGGPQEDMDFADTVVVFEGDGDYAGYHAIVHVDFEATSLYDWYYDIDGWIVEGRLPRG